MKQIEAVLFDFDGTIIDSYPGIQNAFDNAYKKLYSIDSSISIKHLIGPPIQEILFTANGETDINKINLFVSFFKDCYDTEGYKASELYDGIEQLLKTLFNREIKLFIVTNKRSRPTKLIAEYLGIEHYFRDFYCSDTSIGYSSKSEMVKKLLSVENVSAEHCVLIGDTKQDETAAEQNNVSFIYAAFGYGDLKVHQQILKPLEALNFI